MSYHCSALSPQVPSCVLTCQSQDRASFALHLTLGSCVRATPDRTAAAMCPSSRVLSHSFGKSPGLHCCCSRSHIWSAIIWAELLRFCNCLQGPELGFWPTTHRTCCYGTLPTGHKSLLRPVFLVPMLLQHPALRVQVTSVPIKLQPLFHGRPAYSCTPTLAVVHLCSLDKDASVDLCAPNLRTKVPVSLSASTKDLATSGVCSARISSQGQNKRAGGNQEPFPPRT